MLVLTAAAASGLLWIVSWRVTRDVTASWFAWSVAALSVPFAFHSFAVYPDAVAAALILAAVLPLVDERARRPAMLFLVGAALAALPWLHTRLTIAAVALAVVVAARIEPGARWRRLAAFAACPVISAAGWFGFFWITYGTPNPVAQYGGATQLDVAGLGRGAAGLLFDQQFGLLPAAPVYLCALAGLATMLVRMRRLCLELLVVVLPYFVAVAAFPMWWGGVAAPARFLVPVTLVLTIPAAVWFSTRRSTTSRLLGLGGVVLSATIGVAIAGTARGVGLLNSREDASALLLAVSPVVNLTTALPGLLHDTPRSAVVHAAVWLMAVPAALLAGRIAERRGASRRSIAAMAAAAAAAWVLAAVSIVWQGNRAAMVTPLSGSLALLRAFHPDRPQIGVSYESPRVVLAGVPWYLPPRIVPPADVLSRVELSDGTGRLTLPDLLAGDYEIHSTVPADAHARVDVDRRLPPIDEWNATASSHAHRVVLPVRVRMLRVSVEGARRVPSSTVVRPLRLIGNRDGWADTVARTGTRYGPALVFLIRGDADMERDGAWVRGAAFADFVIVPDEGTAIHLFVRNAAIANDVLLEGGSWRETLTLDPREERVVTVPTDAMRVGTALRVTARGGISPAEVDPASNDRRKLGCFIETR